MDPFDSIAADAQRMFSHRRDELPRAVFCCADAADALAAELTRHVEGRCACLVFDVRTRDAAAAPCLDALRRHGWMTHELLVVDRDDGGTPTCDDVTKDRLARALPSADVLIAVGSGVINDLTKWIAAERDLPFAVFATASSMNGYSSSNVAPTIRGVKSLAHARASRVIAADPAILRDAPYRLTASGFGDLLAKHVSTADWIANHALFDETYSPELASLVDRFDAMVFDEPEALARGEESASRSLFEALVLSGCTMTLHGSSLPASGGEHIISHTLDMMSDADGVPHDLHGRQVGVATVFSAALWEELLRMENPRFDGEPPPFDPAIWGKAAAAVQQQRDTKIQVIEKARVRLSRPAAWDALREQVSSHLLPPSLLRARLQRANAAWKLDHIDCSRPRFLAAIRHAGAMRARFTSIDLANAAGLLPDRADELVDSWVV